MGNLLNSFPPIKTSFLSLSLLSLSLSLSPSLSPSLLFLSLPLSLSLSAYGFDLGVAHVDDLQFVFKDSEDAAYAAWTELDDLVRRRICRMWANFARTLDPTPDGEQVGEETKSRARVPNRSLLLMLSTHMGGGGELL